MGCVRVEDQPLLVTVLPRVTGMLLVHTNIEHWDISIWEKIMPVATLTHPPSSGHGATQLRLSRRLQAGLHIRWQGENVVPSIVTKLLFSIFPFTLHKVDSMRLAGCSLEPNRNFGGW